MSTRAGDHELAVPRTDTHSQIAVVLDQVFFSLDRDKFQQFTALLDAPAPPSAGLQRLLAVQPPWVAKAD